MDEHPLGSFSLGILQCKVSIGSEKLCKEIKMFIRNL